MKILLAEDNELNQQLVRRMLEKMGHFCDVAGDGQAALEKIRGQAYDAVLMDGQMPGLDGYAATRRIRELEATGAQAGHIPIIALTGGAAQEDIDACLEAGMDEHLSKPISFQPLADMLSRYAGKASATGNATATTVAPVAEGKDNMRDEIIKDIVAGLNLPAAIAQKLLNEYLKTLPNDVAQLKAAIASGDYAAAAKMAHSIKGASGNLRINKIFETAAELEQALKGAADAGQATRATALFQTLSELVSKLV